MGINDVINKLSINNTHANLWHQKLIKRNLNFNECMHKLKKCVRYKGSNTGKRARRKNLRHPRERFLVFNEGPPNWRPIYIFPAGV